MNFCKFTVTFESNTGYAVDFTNKTIGLSTLDDVRTQLDNISNISIHNIPISLFGCNRPGVQQDVTIEVTETIARKSCLFQDHNAVKVFVPKMFLNDFCDLKYTYDTKNNCVDLKVVINQDKLIDYWAEQNFPTDFTAQ